MSFHLFNEALGKEITSKRERNFSWHVRKKEESTRERERVSFAEERDQICQARAQKSRKEIATLFN